MNLVKLLESRMAVNFSLYFITFVIFYSYHYGEPPLISGRGVDFSIVYFVTWFLSSVFSRKTKGQGTRLISHRMHPYFIALILMLGLYSLYEIKISAYYFSRSVFGMASAAAFIVEMILLLSSTGLTSHLRVVRQKISLRLLLSDFFVFVAVLVYHLYEDIGLIIHDIKSIILLVLFTWLWLIAGLISGNYVDSGDKKDVWIVFWPRIRNYILFAFLIIFLSFYALPPYSEKHLFMEVVIYYACFSFLMNMMLYMNAKPAKADILPTELFAVHEWKDDYAAKLLDNNYQRYDFHPPDLPIARFSENLKKLYLADDPELFGFFNEKIDLKNIESERAVLIRTDDMFNVEIYPENHLLFYCNLLQINNIRRINEYFIKVNNRLVNGGIIAGRVDPAHLQYRKFILAYPYQLARLLYLFQFIWKRLVPKLPLLKSVYFSVTKGKKRAISLAESLGRLYYCGFTLIALKAIDGNVYFIARKTGPPNTDSSPSYGPLIKMKRVGKNGKTIYVYKLRTMHPYSEYLQKFTYDVNNLAAGGKLKDDFRITSWGRVFRRFWIDELPMLINWLKGDLKLVGVRPLSSHYLSLYTPELQEKRIRVKPGLIPPFYVDLPKTLDEIMQSESVYIDMYEKSPFKTDFIYFVKSLYNIFIRGARSK